MPAAGTTCSPDPQLEVLLGTAAEAIDLAKKLADSQPDQAYVQYLRASEITVNTIPHHPDYRSTTLPHPGWPKEFAALMMVRQHRIGIHKSSLYT